jgi:predicted MFS family arabinose efflux permease
VSVGSDRRSDDAIGVALGGFLALAVAMGIGRFVYTPILPYMAESLGLTKAEAGVIASANFAGYLFGALASASTRLPGGRRTWVLAGLAISALSTGAMGASTSLAVFLGLRFVGGVASAFVLVFSSALVLDRLAVAGRPGLSAVHFAGVGFGIAASAVLVSQLSAAGYGWQVLWYYSGLASLIALAAVIWLVPRETPVVPTIEPVCRRDTNRRLRALIAAYGLFGFGYVITATFISTMVRTSFDLRPLESVVWLVVGLAAAPSVAMWAWIGRRLGNGRSFSIACIVEAVGVAMGALSTDAFAVVASAALLGGTFMGIAALGLALAGQLSWGDPRRGLALMTAAFGLGQMIGPTFAGFAYDLGNSFLAPSLAAATALVIAAGLVADPHAPSPSPPGRDREKALG